MRDVHGKHCPIVNGRVDLGCACNPAIVLKCITSYCHSTGNPCGTDTWQVGWTCPCPSCAAYLERRSPQATGTDQGAKER